MDCVNGLLEIQDSIPTSDSNFSFEMCYIGYFNILKEIFKDLRFCPSPFIFKCNRIAYIGIKLNNYVSPYKLLTPTPWLMEPRGSMPHSKCSPIIPIMSQINPIPRFDTYFFKIHSNIVFPSTPSPS